MTSAEMDGGSQKAVFERSPILFWIMIAIIVAVGLAIRLYDLSDAPIDFHATRQMHSALIARGMYYENLPGVPDWQREMAVKQWKMEGLIEPQITERLVALTYGLAGGAYLWIPRLYSIFFWMVGGLFLFLLAMDISGRNGAVIALAYYLILPYGAIASRAFQPEPLLMASMIAAYWGMYRWFRCRTWGRAVLAGLLAGWSIYAKSVAVFFIGGAWLGLLLFGLGLRQAVRSRHVWLMGLLTVLPYAAYHIYGVYIVQLLGDQFNLRFFPQLWRDLTWYLRWNGQISSVVGFEFFLAGLLGLFAIRARGGRWLLVGALFGYFLYGMTFAYHISTHDYYQEPLIPLIAFGLGAGMDALLRRMEGPRLIVYPLVVGVVLFAITIKAWDVRNTLKRDDYHNDPVYWEKLGNTLGHDAQVIGVFQDYGSQLSYWGWVTPVAWMNTGDFNLREMAGQSFNIKKLFEERISDRDFFVVTDFGEYERQPALKELLTENYPLLPGSEDYLVFDLNSPLKKK